MMRTTQFNAVQPEELCFRQTREGVFDCLEARDHLAIGAIKQIDFQDKFLVSVMDYIFRYPTRKEFCLADRFIEILYLESIRAESWEDGHGKFPVETGVSTYVNQLHKGGMIFSPDVPVRGLRILVYEEFYSRYLQERFPGEEFNIQALSRMNYRPYSSPALEFTLRQLKRGMESGTSSALYYEGKIMEILYLLTEEARQSVGPKAACGRHLTTDDREAVMQVKGIVDECLSGTPGIAELALRTHTSAAKLQADFQSAFGCTIHGYVQKARMREALRLIDDTDVPLYAVSRRVGCKSPGYFAALFKETYGMGPAEYRALKKNGVPH